MSKENKFEITDEENWYIIVNNETRGPLSLRDLDVLLRTNDINSRTFAWKNGMKEWKVLNDIEEIKASILESSKEILEIEKKRQHLFDKNQENKPQDKADEQANNQIIENKDENPLTILETTVQNLLKKTFHQTVDGKWNIYDEQKKQWGQQDQEPTQQIEKMKQLLLAKLKNQLFYDQKNKRKKPANAEQKKQPEVPLTQEEQLKKQKNKKKARKQAEKKKEKWYNAKINTFIYISGLPLDITQEQLKQFTNKAGVLRIDLNTGKQKIKIYKDQDGFPKGDAAVSYVRQESVEIAIENLNNKEIRSGFNVIIEKAKFNQKQQTDYKKRQTKKQNLAKKIQQKMLQKKQFSWDQTVDQLGDGLKIVIMKHMIDPNQVNNEEYLEAVKSDIINQLSKIGEIQRVRFYQTHPDGVVEVKFKKQKDAESCILSMHGRFFDDRQIQCDYWDGVTDFKKDAGSLSLQSQRLQKFAKEIEGEDQVKAIQVIEEKPEEQDEDVINNHLLQQA